jgi:hypothetical protein
MSLWDRVERTETCWIYSGALNQSGYGVARYQGRMTVVHRLAYQELVGPIPEGLELDHLCRVRNCVNPAHLEPVTHAENTLRGIGPTAQNARRTECLQGHPLMGPNLYLRPDGRRECRTCKRAA